MTRRSPLIFNILTVVLLAMTCLLGACYGLVALNPNLPINPLKPPPLPTIMPTPVATETSVLANFPTPLPPSATPTITHTPANITDTPSPTASSTAAFATPTPINTPTAVPSLTQAATATFTSTAIPTLSGPTLTPTRTQSAFQFTLQAGSPTYQPNFANTAGCNWMGIAGQAFDLSGRPVIGLIVRLTFPGGSPLDSLTGSKPVYGAAGYEFYLNDHPVATTLAYRVQLLNSSGSPLSDNIVVDTKSDCDKNLVIVNFVQNH